MSASDQQPDHKNRIVTCPTCGGDSLYETCNPWRPFCSERCRKIDFGAWAREDFRSEVKPEPDPTEESES
jgi:endogenous inhibitor of DNA gyrase (YacG/DUF329 family)